MRAKKILRNNFLVICFLGITSCFATTTFYANTPAELVNAEIVKFDNKDNNPLINSGGYFGYEFNNNMMINHPILGYRYQKDSVAWGIDAGFQLSQDGSYFKVGINRYYFPTPSLEGQVFMGVGIDGQFLHKWVSFYNFDKAQNVFYEEFRKCKFFLLTPQLFIGQDFFMSNCQKLFAQITFIPMTIYFGKFKGVDFLRSFGFKVGYGF